MVGSTRLDSHYRVIYECIEKMQDAGSLETASLALVAAAMDLVPCDHAGYSEVDTHFGRHQLYSSERQVAEWVDKRMALWTHHMPDHPVLQFRKANPEVSIVRLSDVTDLTDFYRSGIYNDLFTEVDTRHQLVMHLGFQPSDGVDGGAFPLTLGLPLNRSGADFTNDDIDKLALLRRVARPVLRRKRFEHRVKLLDKAQWTPDLERDMRGLGLTERQAEVAFWILQGKSNSEIGELLDIGTQTARQHSIAIYRRLDVNGRLALQRAVFRAFGGED